MFAEDILLCRKSEKGGFIAYKTDRFIGGKKRTSGSAETKQRSSAALQSRQKPIALKHRSIDSCAIKQRNRQPALCRKEEPTTKALGRRFLILFLFCVQPFGGGNQHL